MNLETLDQSLKKIEDSPSIADKILITFNCPDANGCFLTNPYKFNNFTIYHVNRNYSNNTKYEKATYDNLIKEKLDKAIKTACLNPSQDNLDAVEKLRLDYNNSVNYTTFYYSDAVPVLLVGSDDYPAWVENDIDNSQVYHVTLDEDDNDVFGVFQYAWTPSGMREGDYFLCWTWTPEVSGQVLSNHIHFNLSGNTILTTSIPTHNTVKNKYETLLDRYTPEMFKTRIASEDLTPETIQEFNNAVAKGFTYLEDLSNHMLDLTDANSTHESFLQLLGNLFGIKLKTNDPTLWRRQIKEAVPLFKKKGTYEGLNQALLQAGVKLNKFTRLWQVTSKYTYQEVFTYEGVNQFNLSQISLDINEDNFELYIRLNNSNVWTSVDLSNISLSEDENNNLTILNWNGSLLNEGDSIKIVYQIQEVPDEDEQTLENYIRLLPLSDNRDERDQEYPLKNWNVRLIEEDDAMFDLIVLKKNPDFENLIYGKIRTEFPYSENIYNMEEYNGSTRDSMNPCDIDKHFLDSCHSCLSSKFSIDLEIEKISNDRISEANDVIKDFVPFHAMLHSMNLSGGVTEYVKSPVEKIEALIRVVGDEFTIAGSAQTVFNRTMNNSSQVNRSSITDHEIVESSVSATGYNQKITLYSPLIDFNDLPLNKNKDWTYLEISGPSLNQGVYEIERFLKNSISISNTGDVYLPLDKTVFNYKLSNIMATKTSIAIYKDNYITFNDSNASFDSVKTEWDVTNDQDYVGGTWKINFPSYGTFNIKNILPNNIILLDYDSSLPTSTTSSVTYEILDDLDNVIFSANTGRIKVTNRGRVDFSGSFILNDETITLDEIRTLMDSYHENGRNYYLLYNNVEYEFDGFVEGSTTEFFIKNWNSSDFSGSSNVKLLQRLVNNEKGYLQYNGFYIDTDPNDFESNLPIQNGANSSGVVLENDTFKENYLIKINSNYYSIIEIDEFEIYLAGPEIDCTLEGMSLSVDILKYSKLSFSVSEEAYPPMHAADFNFIDRRGKEIITGAMPEVFSLAFNANKDQIVEKVDQNEAINYTITNFNGDTTEGSI